jgi:hypothetical protein
VSKTVFAPLEVLLLHSYDDFYGNRDEGRTDLPEIRRGTPGMLAWAIVCDAIVTANNVVAKLSLPNVSTYSIYQKTRLHTPEDALGVTTVSTSNVTSFYGLMRTVRWVGM